MNPKIANAIKNENCSVVGWDLRSQDGRIRTKEATVNRVKNHLKVTLLLFHDTNPTTPEALEDYPSLSKEWHEIVSLPELINVKPYA